MVEQANECVIVVESDDDDDIIVVDEHGNPSEHDVIFVRRDRRRTGRNQPFPDKISSNLSENASNQPKNDTIEGGGKNIHHLVDKLGSPERPSDPGEDTRKITPKVEELSNDPVMWKSDMKVLQSAFNLSPLSPDVKSIANEKLSSRHIADLLSPASPGASIDSTDVAGRNSPSPFLDNKGSSMWSPTSPDASKNSTDIARRSFPSRFSDLISPASPDACINNTDIDAKHCPSHYSDDIDSTVSSPVSPGASIDSTDISGRNSPGPFSDNGGSSLFSPASPDASLDSADLYEKHSPFHCSNDDSALSNPTKSMNSIDSDTVVGNFSSSQFVHSNDSSLLSPASPDATKNSVDAAWGYFPPRHSSISCSSNASVSGTDGSNSPPPFSGDGFSLSPASPGKSVDSADISVTVKSSFTANNLTSTDDKKSATSLSDGFFTDALSVLTRKSKDKTLCTRAPSQLTASMQQVCTCKVTQAMCRTCIANLDNTDAKSKTSAIISQLTASSHNTPSTSFTSGQTRSAIIITDGSKQYVIGGNRPPMMTLHHLPASSSQIATTRPNTGVPRSKRSFGNAINGTSDSTIVLSKKQRLYPSASQPLHPSASQLLPSTSGMSSVDTSIDRNLCFGCGILITTGNLSQCLDNHRCCSQCLQEQAKSLLTKQSKGSLKCFYPGCESFYPLSQLRNTLPAMVIEIVEEKLEQESLEDATKFMLGQMGHVSGEEMGRDSFDKKERVDTWNLPRYWEPMDINGDMRIVEVMPGSESYLDAVIMFHNTMNAPRAEVVRVRRVQNPILWQFYSVKRRQMLNEIGSEELREMKLFHGTSNSVVDAICKSNFDWRLCGTHGTVFGQGSYFARDAKYAHMYTDGGNATMRTTPGTAGLPVQHFLQSLSATLSTPQILISPSSGLFFPSRISTGISAALATGGSAPVWQNTTASGQQQCRSRHTMFIARVLVGKYTIGYPALRKPPPLNPSDMYGKSYDSCVNDVNDPRIYVIFDNAQCYPEYIIEYMNAPRWAIMTQ